MQTLKKVLIVVGVLVVLNLAVTGINILQNGGKYDGRSMEKILGVSPEKATLDDINKLSKAEVFQLFYAAPAPAFGEMKGEYAAAGIEKGILGKPTALYTDHVFGEGRWEGKAFFPFKKDSGQGYNISRDSAGKIHRTRRMDTKIGPSDYDGKPSFKLDYSAYNSREVNSMRDELRRINKNLYLGMGYMGFSGGALNPAPFVVMGPAKEWVGPDKK